MPTLRERLAEAADPRTELRVKTAAGGAFAAGAAVMGGAAAPLVAAVGLTALTGGLALFGLGAAFLLPAALRVVKPRIRKDAARGDEIAKQTADYRYWDCHMSRVSVLGIRGTGKSTVRQLLRGLALTSIVSTEHPEYYVIDLKTNPASYVILIDSPGMLETAGDQWKAARDANILIFVFDHFDTRDKGSTETSVDDDRLSRHHEFVRQIFERVREHRKDDIRKVIILISKKDLWMAGADRENMEQWASGLKSDMIARYSTLIPDPLPFREFDRSDANDLMWLLNEIRRAAAPH